MNYPIYPVKNDVIDSIRNYIRVDSLTVFNYSFVISGLVTTSFEKINLGTEVVFSYTPNILSLYYRECHEGVKYEKKIRYDCVLSFLKRSE